MSKIVLHYNLSETAQRVELAAGRPAHRERAFELEPTLELARIAKIANDGSAKIERYSTNVDSSYAAVRHDANRVLADQADACLFLTECQTAIDAKVHEIRTKHIKQEHEQRERCEQNSAAILALTADAIWNADGQKLENAPHVPGGECSEEAAAHRKALWAEQQRREKAAHERPEVEARAWAAEYGEAAFGSLPLQRAATEGRRVRGEITKLVRERLAMTIAAAADGVLLPDYYSEKERNDVPTAEAYELYDSLKIAKTAIASAAKLPNVEVEIGDVCRIDVAPSGSADWRTGVLVTVSHPWLTKMLTYAVVCESEAADLPIGKEEDEDY